MQRLSYSRKGRTDLLVRPPCTARDLERGWAALFVDPVEQLDQLAQLYRRGLLSREEFEAQKAKVIGP
jgi:Short C-terminal domain